MSKSVKEQIVAVEAQIATLTAKLAALREKAANLVDVSRIVADATVEFTFGRAEKKRTVVGEVRKVVEGVATILVDGDEVFVTKLSVDLVTKVVSSPVPSAEDAAEVAAA